MERSKYAPGNYGQTKSPTDIFHGFIDPVMTIGGGLLGSTVGGLMALPVLATKGADEAQMMLESAQNRAGYNPVNPTGVSATNELMGALNTIAQPLEAISQGVGDYVYNKTGSPAMGAIGQLTPDLLATAIGLPPALRAGRKLNNIGSKINPTTPPVTPFSKQQGVLSHPLKDGIDIEDKYADSADIGIYESDRFNNIDLSKIVVDKGLRKQGIGSDIMRDVVDYADQYGRRVDLTPATDYGATSINRLKKFYKQFGFVENKGRNLDLSISQSMYRKPKRDYDALRAEANANRFSDDLPNTDYKISHTAAPIEQGTSLDDLSNIYPDDVYSDKGARYYGHYGGNDYRDIEAINIMKQAKGNPNAELTIYRAVPKGIKNINTGDWVTIRKGYAKEHGDSWVNDGSYDIISKKVKAKDVFTQGDSLQEWGYNPQ